MLGVIPRIISEEHEAFGRGRSISDHLLLAQEVFNKVRFSKDFNGFLAIKVDMKEAYDSMCWATLEKMMTELGFPTRFIHLVMEYEILLFMEAKVNGMKKVREIMKNYCKWTGQSINYHKSTLVCGSLMDRRRRMQISKFMGIRLVDEFEYLGIKLALRRLRRTFRLVLVKSVYLSLPIFIMSHSLIPMKMLMEFEKICRGFIWNKCDGKRGIHYVAWEQICKPKKFGGWDVNSAVARRNTMRAKFAWKMIDKPDSLLSKHLTAK
ncbi:uncharacterized protein LOC110114626 [Dendrobium catenatum]|uniref:uncharacterized protein LOC110114626 n=1 Tax=Dendrobium catenatum TaxID=906689 RepID=UPI00109F4FCC|nr:uncharacterized protein LOC110114626 [Dendrobium catenatum]